MSFLQLLTQDKAAEKPLLSTKGLPVAATGDLREESPRGSSFFDVFQTAGCPDDEKGEKNDPKKTESGTGEVGDNASRIEKQIEKSPLSEMKSAAEGNSPFMPMMASLWQESHAETGKILASDVPVGGGSPVDTGQITPVGVPVGSPGMLWAEAPAAPMGNAWSGPLQALVLQMGVMQAGALQTGTLANGIAGETDSAPKSQLQRMKQSGSFSTQKGLPAAVNPSPGISLQPAPLGTTVQAGLGETVTPPVGMLQPGSAQGGATSQAATAQTGQGESVTPPAGTLQTGSTESGATSQAATVQAGSDATGTMPPNSTVQTGPGKSLTPPVGALQTGSAQGGTTSQATTVQAGSTTTASLPVTENKIPVETATERSDITQGHQAKQPAGTSDNPAIISETSNSEATTGTGKPDGNAAYRPFGQGGYIHGKNQAVSDHTKIPVLKQVRLEGVFSHHDGSLAGEAGDDRSKDPDLSQKVDLPITADPQVDPFRDIRFPVIATEKMAGDMQAGQQGMADHGKPSVSPANRNATPGSTVRQVQQNVLANPVLLPALTPVPAGFTIESITLDAASPAWPALEEFHASHFSESVEEVEEKEQRMALSRMSLMPVANADIRQEFLQNIYRLVHHVRKSAQQKPGSWMNHRFAMEGNREIRISMRETDGVLQLRLGSSSSELSRILHQHLHDIRQHLEKECGIRIELEMDGDDSDEFTPLFEDSSHQKARTGDRENHDGSGKTEPQAVDSIVPKPVRDFGYNKMEWTA